MPAEESFFCRLFSWKVQIWFLSDAYPFSVWRISGSCPTHFRLLSDAYPALAGRSSPRQGGLAAAGNAKKLRISGPPPA